MDEKITVQDLQQLFFLEKLIRLEQNKLEDLRSAVLLKSTVLTDMPKAPGARDRIGDTVPSIVDQEEKIIETLKAYTECRDRLSGYISSIPNARIKLILTLRFIEQKSWQEVADAIGGRETEYSVKHACYRYMEGQT